VESIKKGKLWVRVHPQKTGCCFSFADISINLMGDKGSNEKFEALLINVIVVQKITTPVLYIKRDL
jgi:hypothetical protein